MITSGCIGAGPVGMLRTFASAGQLTHRFAAASEAECCAYVSADTRVANPIVAWAFSNSSTDHGGACVFHRLKALQTRVVYPQPAASLASQAGCDAPGTAYYAEPDATCGNFSAAVGALPSAPGIVTYPRSAALTRLGAIASKAACCARCSLDDHCVAWQHGVAGAAVCDLVSSAILAEPDVSAVDVPGWVATLPGEGVFYWREPLAPPAPPPAPPAAPGVLVDPAATACAHFSSVVAANGATILDSPGVSASLGNASQSILYEAVRTEAGCCALAHRFGCSDNPVRLWQLVPAVGCVVQRSGLLQATGAADATPVAAAMAAATGSAAAPLRVFYSEMSNINHDHSQCDDDGPYPPTYTGPTHVAPCHEDQARAVCASASEPCFYEPTCKLGGLGCNAAGFESCRFCGFGDYENVTCPNTLNTTRVTVEVTVPGQCPTACTSNSWETCFYDPACVDPLHPEYNGGLGCNAGGKGQACRFCGFVAHNGSDLHAGQEYWNGVTMKTYPECPSPELTHVSLFAEAATAMRAVSADGAAAAQSSARAETTTQAVLVTDGSASAESTIASLQEAVRTRCADPNVVLHVVSSSTTSLSRRMLLDRDAEEASLARTEGWPRRRMTATEVLTVEYVVAVSSADPSAAAVDALVNDPTQLQQLLVSIPGVVDGQASSTTATSTHLTLSANPQDASDLSAMESAIQSAVATSLGAPLSSVTVQEATVTQQAPINPFDPILAYMPGVPPPPPTPPYPPGQRPPNPPPLPTLSGSGRRGEEGLAPWAIAVIVGACCICGLAILGMVCNTMQSNGATKGSAAAQGWRSAALAEAMPKMGNKQVSILPGAPQKRESFTKLGDDEAIELTGDKRPSKMVSDAI